MSVLRMLSMIVRMLSMIVSMLSMGEYDDEYFRYLIFDTYFVRNQVQTMEEVPSQCRRAQQRRCNRVPSNVIARLRPIFVIRRRLLDRRQRRRPCPVGSDSTVGGAEEAERDGEGLLCKQAGENLVVRIQVCKGGDGSQ
jgi:hypothetical protein